MTTKEITEYYFKRQRDTDDLYVCRCGKRRKQNPRRGYGNLMDHIRSDHPKYLEELRESDRSPFPLGNISEKAHNIYGWLHWVITDVYPFSFVDKKDTTQQYSTFNPHVLRRWFPICRRSPPLLNRRLPIRYRLNSALWWMDGQKCQRPCCREVDISRETYNWRAEMCWVVQDNWRGSRNGWRKYRLCNASFNWSFNHRYRRLCWHEICSANVAHIGTIF